MRSEYIIPVFLSANAAKTNTFVGESSSLSIIFACIAGRDTKLSEDDDDETSSLISFVTDRYTWLGRVRPAPSTPNAVTWAFHMTLDGCGAWV